MRKIKSWIFENKKSIRNNLFYMGLFVYLGLNLFISIPIYLHFVFIVLNLKLK